MYICIAHNELLVKHRYQTNSFSGHAENALARQLDDADSQAVNTR